MEKELSDYFICELVKELKKREGVEEHIAEPYQDLNISIIGPARILVVTD